jgi:hypothetical protein
MRRTLIALAAAFLLVEVSPVFEPVAQAQTAWGTARRTGRRSGRRASRRHDYYYGSMPGGYTTAVYGGVPYYGYGGAYYQPEIVEGDTYYVEVQPPPEAPPPPQ